ncbi:hypothetical protein OH492_20515 [Vibrio chagasii]|nr:hypothetical protein [Vibrio chagasii]
MQRHRYPLHHEQCHCEPAFTVWYAMNPQLPESTAALRRRRPVVCNGNDCGVTLLPSAKTISSIRYSPFTTLPTSCCPQNQPHQ